jgi:hypothetical protein
MAIVLGRQRTTSLHPDILGGAGMASKRREFLPESWQPRIFFRNDVAPRVTPGVGDRDWKSRTTRRLPGGCYIHGMRKH